MSDLTSNELIVNLETAGEWELLGELSDHERSNLYFQAANVIRQLVRERNAAIESIPKSCSKCVHSQDGNSRVLADGKTDDFCLTCVRNRRCNFKWRGVQE